MKRTGRNFLEYVYRISDGLSWNVSDDGIVTVDMENKGFANRVAQRFFHRPRISHITLEGMGSFIFTQIDGVRTVYDIGVLVGKRFGNEAEPLYERLSVYMKKLEQVGFIKLTEKHPRTP